MDPSLTAALILIGAAVALLVLLIVALAKGWLSSSGTGGASLTMLHDLSPSDKQHAIEYVMEQKAGKRLGDQESGEGKDPDSTSAPETKPS